MKKIRNAKKIGERKVKLGYGGGSGIASLVEYEELSSTSYYEQPQWKKCYMTVGEFEKKYTEIKI